MKKSITVSCVDIERIECDPGEEFISVGAKNIPIIRDRLDDGSEIYFAYSEDFEREIRFPFSRLVRTISQLKTEIQEKDYDIISMEVGLDLYRRDLARFREARLIDRIKYLVIGKL